MQIKEITADYGSTERQWEPGLASTIYNPTLNALVGEGMLHEEENAFSQSLVHAQGRTSWPPSKTVVISARYVSLPLFYRLGRKTGLGNEVTHPRSPSEAHRGARI